MMLLEVMIQVQNKSKVILSNVLTEIHKSLNRNKVSALNKDSSKSNSKISLKFPKIKKRRQGFIVNKNISK